MGYDRVYRIKAINKFYSNSTFSADDVGLMRIYMEITEASPDDDFVHRIAKQADEPVTLSPVAKPGDLNYTISFATPDYIAYNLGDTPVDFMPVLKFGEEVIDGVAFKLEATLENLPKSVDPGVYLGIEHETGSNTFSLWRKRIYLRGQLCLKWYVAAEDSPTGEEIATVLKLDLR